MDGNSDGELFAHGRATGRPLLLAIVGYALLGLAWLVATPPWGSPDEPALIKAVALADGQVLGRVPDYPRPPATVDEAWYRRLTRVVSVPRRTQPPRQIPCYAFASQEPASCLRVTRRPTNGGRPTPLPA